MKTNVSYHHKHKTMENIMKNTEDFIKEVNTIRLSNKDKWYSWAGMVNGYEVSLKAFNTWVQVINIGMIKESGPMDCTPKEFKQFLASMVA